MGEVLRKYRLALKAWERACVRLEEARKRAAKGCNHPPDLIAPYSWEHDNGHGRQARMKGSKCTLCWKVKRWNTWE